MSDSVPVISRHFEAKVPPPQASLQDPIHCTPVQLDLDRVAQVMLDTDGIEDVAIRSRHDGTPEAFVSIDLQADVGSAFVKQSVAQRLPGYAVPEIHFLDHALPRIDGDFDFASMEKEIMRQNDASMSPQAVVIRDIVADLLGIEPGTISGSADFFLLGGNSLLLGKLSYHIRKRTNISIPVAAIFTNSSINGIGSLIEIEQRKMSLESLIDDKLGTYPNTVNNSELTLGDNYYNSFASDGRKGRGQNHPINLVFQAIPIIFFYPLKTAVTCKQRLPIHRAPTNSFTGSILLFILSYLSPFFDHNYWERMFALLCAIVIARFSVRVCAPVAAIVFKWTIIGRYKPGHHRVCAICLFLIMNSSYIVF